ncbi:hypothetical protein DSO57_1026237 [Entomophthora muscae]|uniref:Uncharacterized protein n=1 Tax=Entomophthora muscae TaxID=34485 RepID=A0ACC2TD85_9FUNG|nr:hypothetical protein DSO57_1026237 [Entomophthora muscae]
MEYTAPAIPSIIPKETNHDKPKEPAKITAQTVKEPAKPAKNATQTEELPGYFALSQDFEEDPIHQLVANNLYAIPARGRGRPQKITANAVEVVSKPYAAQVQETCLNNSPNVSSNVPNLKGVQLAMPLKTIENNFPEIGQSLKQYFDTPAPLGIHLLNLQSETYSKCTYANISVNKVKVRAIIDSRAPINIISTRLVQKLGLAPDIAHNRVYSTAGLHTTTSEGAYSVKIDMEKKTFTILKQTIPLYYTKDTTSIKEKLTINLAYKDGIVAVPYKKKGRKSKKLPTQIKEHKGIPLCSLVTFTLKSGTQRVVPTGLTLEIPKGLYGEIHQPWGRSRFKPCVAPGIIIPGHGEVHILLANLQDHNIYVKKHQIVGFMHLPNIEELAGFKCIGDLLEMGLPDQVEASAYVTTPLSDLSSLNQEQQEQASALFEKYRCIFAKDDFDLGCAADVTHHIDTGDNKPIWLCPI